MNRNLIIYLALLLAAFASCNKTTEKPTVTTTTSDTMFRMVNHTLRDLHVDMYTSSADRNNHVNARYSCDVPAKNTYKIPFSALDTTATYFYDYFTPDYVYANWGSYNTGLPLFFQGHMFFIDSNTLTQARYYYLKGNNTSVTWVAVDKRYENNTSLWSTLDANGKYLRVVLKADYTGSVNRKQTGGTIQTDNIYSMNSNRTSALTDLQLSTDGGSYSLYNTSVPPGLNGTWIPNNDTLMMEDFNTYWVLVRE